MQPESTAPSTGKSPTAAEAAEAQRKARNTSREAARLLRDAAWPERAHLLWGTLGLALAAGLEMLGPLAGKMMIDRVLLPRNPDAALIVGLLVGSLLAGFAASWLRYLQLLRLAGLAMRSVQRIRERVYAHVLRLPMAFFDRAITGQLVTRVTNDTEAAKNLYVQVLFVGLDSTIVLIGATLAMWWVDPHLMLMVAAMLPAAVLIMVLYRRWAAGAVTRARELRSQLNARMAESIAGVAVMQAANATERFNQQFAQLNESHYAARMRTVFFNAWLLRPTMEALKIVMIAVVIGLVGMRSEGMLGVLGGPAAPLAVGVLYAFISYANRVVEPLNQITMQFAQLQDSMVGAARVQVLLQEAEAPAPPARGEVSQGAIAIRDLNFEYMPGRPVLQGISLDIPAGAFYGVVGHTGSGKTTLLSLLLRFYAAPPGTVRIDGQPVEDFAEDHLRDRVGLVPQEPFLLADTARGNIDMGRGLSDAQIEAAARAAHAHDFIVGLEQGYATPLGEGGARLSVGQKQLLAIARALAGQPRILFLDEATSHIDSETEQIVQRALAELRGQVTIVAIAHRLSTVRDADAIVVLNHGRLAELGPHDSLMQIEGGLYQRLYLLQQLEEDPDLG